MIIIIEKIINVQIFQFDKIEGRDEPDSVEKGEFAIGERVEK